MENETKYHYAREIIFQLRVNRVIEPRVYLAWLNKIDVDEKQPKKLNGRILAENEACPLKEKREGVCIHENDDIDCCDCRLGRGTL